MPCAPLWRASIFQRYNGGRFAGLLFRPIPDIARNRTRIGRPADSIGHGRTTRRLHLQDTTGRVRRMRHALLLFLAGLAGCASMPAMRDGGATYLLVRHAEKDVTAGKDPPLTTIGEARAQRLAASLADQPLDAIYSSPTRRTRQTAAPVARAKAQEVIAYDPADAAAFARRLRAEHPAGTVLVIGHSDTLPPLARALCGCTVPDMDERSYGIRYTVHFDADGQATLREFRD